MRPIRLPSTRVAALAVLALIAAAGVGIALTRGAADAAEPVQAPFVSYVAPQGPELSPAAAASVALRDAREFGETGQVTIELARATLTQAKALMEGGSLATGRARESALASTAPSGTFCFGGQNASCTTAEQQHAREVLYEEGQASTYLVAMVGKAFAPAERLPRGARPIVGDTVVMLIDAHTGIRIGLDVGPGTTPPELGELEGLSRFVAASGSTLAQAAGLSRHDRPLLTSRGGPSHSHPLNVGSVRGTFSRAGEVVVYRRRSVFGRAKVRRGRFEMPRVFEGSYEIAGRLRSGRYCRAKHIVVRPRQETIVHLGC